MRRLWRLLKKMKIRLSDGEFLVKFARQVIEEYFGKERVKTVEDNAEILSKSMGVYVIFRVYPKGYIRGCAGYMEPIMNLERAIRELTIYAAVRDIRYNPIRSSELNAVIIEISLLSKPEIIEVESTDDYIDKIKIGRDGLIVERGRFRGIMLPQIPFEQKWGPKELLSLTCLKAGLEADAYIDGETKIYRFTADIFTETEPRGKVIRRIMK